jgi:hypothetical protein
VSLGEALDEEENERAGDDAGPGAAGIRALEEDAEQENAG